MVVSKAMDVPDRSTSENTAPNPLTPAGTVPPVPGMEKTPSVILLPIGANRRFGLKGANSAAYWALIRSRLSRPPVAAAWVRPVPGVVNVAPRSVGAVRNVVKGVTGAVPLMTGGPPPSQLISRRPVASGPAALPLLGLPSAALKSLTVSVIANTFAPLSEKMVNAVAPVGTVRPTAANPTAKTFSTGLMTAPFTLIEQPSNRLPTYPDAHTKSRLHARTASSRNNSSTRHRAGELRRDRKIIRLRPL